MDALLLWPSIRHFSECLFHSCCRGFSRDFSATQTHLFGVFTRFSPLSPVFLWLGVRRLGPRGPGVGGGGPEAAGGPGGGERHARDELHGAGGAGGGGGEGAQLPRGLVAGVGVPTGADACYEGLRPLWDLCGVCFFFFFFLGPQEMARSFSLPVEGKKKNGVYWL